MPVSFTIGSSDVLSLKTLIDLEHREKTLLKLGPEFQQYLQHPVAELPHTLRTSSIQYSSGNQTWAPGPFSFTLADGAAGKLSIVTEGELLAFCATLPTQTLIDVDTTSRAPATQSVPVPNGKAFVALELNFQMSGGLTASYTAGVYGVSTANTAAAAVTVTHFCVCDLTTPLQDAVLQAFGRFVLPLHANTLDKLNVGDYLHYNFNANLQLGFGASIGFDKVCYAGQYKMDVPTAAGALRLQAALEPDVLFGAKLAYQYDHFGSFEMLLWRETNSAGHIHLYRSKRNVSTLGLQAGVTFTAGASTSVKVIRDQLATTLTHALPDTLQGAFTKSVLTPGFEEVTKYAGELSKQFSSWLTRVGEQKCILEKSFETLSERFLLVDYTVDLTQPFQPAWAAMMDGRFVDAMEMPGTGVTLAKGSGLESIFTSITSMTLNVFGALHASWSAATISSSSLVYAGNKTFHLVAREGRELLRKINNATRQMDLYFAAEVDLTDTGIVAPNVDLHVVLQAINDASFGEYIARITGLLSSGPAGACLAKAVRKTAAQPSGVEILHLIFHPSAYSKLQASAIVQGKPAQEARDRTNYEAFASACGHLFQDPPSNFVWNNKPLTYDLWRASNIASNDQWPAPANALPDRTSSAGYNSSAMAQLEGVFPHIGLAGQGAFFCLAAAAQFMNLCGDLQGLATEEPVTLDTWNRFLEHLQAIVHNHVNPYFIAPSALAVAALCGGAPTTISGPAPELPRESSIAITMTYR